MSTSVLQGRNTALRVFDEVGEASKAACSMTPVKFLSTTKLSEKLRYWHCFTLRTHFLNTIQTGR